METTEPRQFIAELPTTYVGECRDNARAILASWGIVPVTRSGVDAGSEAVKLPPGWRLMTQDDRWQFLIDDEGRHRASVRIERRSDGARAIRETRLVICCRYHYAYNFSRGGYDAYEGGRPIFFVEGPSSTRGARSAAESSVIAELAARCAVWDDHVKSWQCGEQTNAA